MAIDPVCGMDVEEGTATETAEHNGKTIISARRDVGWTSRTTLTSTRPELRPRPLAGDPLEERVVGQLLGNCRLGAVTGK